MTDTATPPATPTAPRTRRHTARALRAVSRSADPILSGTALVLVVAAAINGSLPPAWTGLVLLLALVGLISVVERAAVAVADAIDPDLRDGDAACEAAALVLRSVAQDLRDGADPTDVHEALRRSEALSAARDALDALADELARDCHLLEAAAVRDAARALDAADRALAGHTETEPEQR